jgi:steroid-24-oyl-CoA synthetase
VLIRGGENVYCVEVEDALYSHPAAVIGIPHRGLGEEVGAVV